MTYVAPVSSAFVEIDSRPEVDRNLGKDHSLRYVLAFAAVGVVFSILSFALTPTELLPKGAAALAPDIQMVAG